MEIDGLRKAEKELRAVVWDLQDREEKLVAKCAQMNDMEKEIQRYDMVDLVIILYTVYYILD